MAALLAFAPAAMAVTFTVDDSGDASDFDTADGICDTTGGAGEPCTLRAAIEQANALAGADDVAFTVSTVSPLMPLPPVTEQLAIDGGATRPTVTWPAAVPGTLLAIDAPDSRVHRIALQGGGTSAADTVLAVTGARFGSAEVTVMNTDAAAIFVSGAGAKFDRTTVLSARGAGIALRGTGALITTPDVHLVTGEGISVTGNGTRIEGGTVHHNGSSGIGVGAQGVVITRTVIYANSGKPIALLPSANGGVQAPQNVRIGPRRGDGSLPLTGVSDAGTIELWTGNPFSQVAPSFLEAFGVPGSDFSHQFATEPPPGAVFSLNVTSGGGTSEYAVAVVPNDLTSPDVVSARAVSTTEVKLLPNETIDPTSVQPSDFTLFMAGQQRTISAVEATQDGSEIKLISSGWKPGEAGFVSVNGAAAYTDPSGNENMNAPRLRVYAAPGDFAPPTGSELKVAPKTICLTRGSTCRKPGMVISVITTERGKANVVIQRGNKRVGARSYSVTEGLNKLKFNGRLGGRKLRVGRYRMLIFLTDQVGNQSNEPPITLFSIRRTTR